MASRTVSIRLIADIGSFISGMTRAGASASGLASVAGKALGAAGLLGGFTAAASASADFEQAMSGVRAATMASAATMGQLREAALRAGADTAFSAGEAADGIREMAKAGVSTADIMGGGLSGALSLAAAGQMEVGAAAEIASVAMTQFNLSGKDLPHVADLLAAGAGKAMGEVSDLGAALGQAGLVASAAGLSIEETTGTLSAFAAAGLIGSDAGTSLKTMLQRLQNPSDEAAATMQELGVSMYDASGQFVGMEALAGQLRGGMEGMTPAARDAAMAVIFGSDAVRAANVLYAQGAEGIAEWTSKVDDAGYAAEQAGILQDNLKGDLEKLGGAFNALMIDLGEGSQGPLRMFAQGLTGIVNVIGPVMGAIGDLVGWFTDLPGPVLAGVGVLTALMLLNGPLAGAIGVSALALASWYGRAVAAAGGAGILSVAMAGLRGAAASTLALLGGPLGLVITGVVVGLGFLASALFDSSEAAYDAEGAQQRLKQALEESNGAIDDNVRAAAAKEAQDAGLLDMAERAGISLDLMTDAILGQPGALAEAQAALAAYREENTEMIRVRGGSVASLTEEGEAAKTAGATLADLAGKIPANAAAQAQLTEAVHGTTGAMAEGAAQTAEAIAVFDEWIAGYARISESFIEPLAVYKTLLQEKGEAERAAAEKTAAETADASDSWEDFVTGAQVNLQEYATALDGQIAAMEMWRTNLVTVSQRGGVEVAQILADMGVEGAQITADMAVATEADFQHMKDSFIRESHLAGAGANAEFGQALRVMELIGQDGSVKTVQAVARELGRGVAQVRAIANQYGVELASGINPILTSLGRPHVKLSGLGGYNTGGGYAEGGYTGDGGKYQPRGVVHGGEWVTTKEKTAQYRPVLEAIHAGTLPGYATGGFVSTGSVPKPRSTAPYGPPISTAGDGTMQKGYDETVSWLAANLPPPWAGGGAGTANGVGRLGPAAARAHQFVRSNWGFGGTIGGYAYRNIAGTNQLSKHALGKAIDVMIGTNMRLGQSIADYFSGPGRGPFGVDNVIWNRRINSGRGWTGYSGSSPHTDHPHIDFYKTGTFDVPHDGLAYLHKGEAVVPAAVNARSWEFSGGGGSGGGSGSMSVNITGAQIVGTLDLGEGITARIDGRIVQAFGGVTDRGRYSR